MGPLCLGVMMSDVPLVAVFFYLPVFIIAHLFLTLALGALMKLALDGSVVGDCIGRAMGFIYGLVVIYPVWWKTFIV